ncbi:cupin domain-containing protein [Pseudomonas mandelii]|uniref:Cupin n=1 Tax=Pseudomonas mandelii PD30 TaxID=1419583 RepID=A0A059L8A2_9PSED|nr:cupin domain-containing protein [Pseudomonas mandelii]KDD70456.1 cupin [Pseudomonas mandelii PD30]
MTTNTIDKPIPSAGSVIAALNLEPHMEGGFYRRTFQTDHHAMVETAGGRRYLMTSIYYLLTKDSPIGHFHLNQSDIVHYYHVGDAIQYSLIFPDGTLKTVVMGSDIIAGQCLQLHVPGGVWKASQLTSGLAGYGLISEAVSPGFDFADMEMGSQQKLSEQFPEHTELFEKLMRE